MSIGLDEIIKIAKSIGKRSDFYGPDTALLILEAADDLDAFTQRYHEYMTEDQKQLLGYVDKPKDHGIDRILENWPAPPEKEKFWDQGTINKMAGRRRALLLGCAEYAHFSILSSTLNDISAMNNVLADKKIGCFASIDQIENTKEYSAHEILSIIIDWMNNSSRDDTLLLYFSGHAFALNSNSGLYLATEQTLRNDPETAINFQNVLDAFAHCKAPSLLAILDCCQSGAASSQVSRTLVPRTKSGDTPYNEHFGYGGLRVMTSSTMGQPSFEGAPGALSPFTEVLVRGLQEGIADTDRDGIISDVELFSFVERTRQAGNIEGLKTPTHNVLDGRTPYLVALNRFAVEDVRVTDLPEEHIEKYVALKTVVDLVSQCAPVSFMVSCFHYYFLDVGGSALASGLTLSATHTPFLAVSSNGLVCDAFFERHMVPKALAEQQPGKGLVRTRLEVRWEDIIFVAGSDLRTGKQWNLLVPADSTIKHLIG